MIARPCRAATAASAVHVGGLPVEVHREDGRVRGVTAAAPPRGRASAAGSMSAKTGRAPAIMMASAV